MKASSLGRWCFRYWCDTHPGAKETFAGYHTAVATDIKVVAEQWRWVRVQPQSVDDVELVAVTAIAE